ncbi:MAG: BMC domain-containing protein [Anaerolineae bacterium]
MPALALIEFDSIAVGIVAGDAMVKTAPVARIIAGTVHPGKYLVLVTGAVEPVQAAHAAGLAAGSAAVVDALCLPQVHPAVAAGLAAVRQPQPLDALGILETTTVAAAIQAADVALKGAHVTLLELRLADGLGGKGVAFFAGAISDVQAAVEIGSDVLLDSGHLLQAVVIPQLHPEMQENLLAASRFRARI